MNSQLRILSGARSGRTLLFTRHAITAGRSLDADLRFDPEERAVSGRHALIFFAEGRWFVRDLGSTNGTFLNDSPVSGSVRLSDGDRITFGAGGPAVEFRGVPAAGAQGPPAGPLTVERVRFELARSTRRVRMLSAGLVLVLASGLGVSFYLESVREERWDRERASLQLQLDSIERVGSGTIRSLEAQLQGLTAALARSQSDVRTLEVALQRAETGGEAGRVEELRRELQAATAALRRQQSAASLDFRALQGRSRPAVARVFVEHSDGAVVTGTAFAVRRDATLVTSRHVVVMSGGARPRRLAVQFSDSEQVWPARILAVSEEADLAVVKVDNILGDVPTVRGLNLRADTLAPGAPVALLGFPLGGIRGDGGGGSSVARPSLSAGVVRVNGPERMQVQGYGAVGASGSPILDANGEVVAVLFGGREEGPEPMLFGVPAPAVARLLDSLR